MKLKININNSISPLHDLLSRIKENISKNASENNETYNLYQSKVQDLSLNNNKLKENELRVNFINETSYFVFLCYLYSGFIQYKFNRVIPIEYLAKKLDTDMFYSWYELTDELKAEVLYLIDDKFIHSISEDYISQFYESLLDRNEKKRLGQFYTPKEIVDLIVYEANIDFDEVVMHRKIIDPACGAGVFLTRIIKKMEEKCSGMELVEYVYENLFGNDINPFAVVLTKLNLTFSLIEHIKGEEELLIFLEEFCNFPNVILRNTLMDTENRNYDVIIGNPPYFKTTTNKELSFYSEIIYGQPNVYGLFLYWALRHVSTNGMVSFIIPQSFKSGLYFLKLREILSKLELVSLISFKSRKKIFKDVEQAVVILTVKNSMRAKKDVNVISKVDNQDKETTSFQTSMDNIIMDRRYNYFIFIPSTDSILGLIEKIYNTSTNLKENGDYLFGTGAFVWNQHKDLLIEQKSLDTIPIVYASYVEKFNFITKDIYNEKIGKKQFASNSDRIGSMISTGQKLIVQRTSTFEDLQRIKACKFNDDFIVNNSQYLLENHLNFLYKKNVKSQEVDTNALNFYLGIINSRLLNVLFSVKNGNTQVSSSELNLLPIANRHQDAIIEAVSRLEGNLTKTAIDILDEIVYENYALSSSEIDIVRNYRR
ncbi:N-6 DNA methylase [Paenibacillus agaridevorans]|uniref:N-6 DNA methylase n=1 Tax=Paenibacillus agaridevorans TaxID=171404 RepID=UPI001BE3E642|nr:N-6 DNA methylase [Paenibacillus agaridevorans]